MIIEAKVRVNHDYRCSKCGRVTIGKTANITLQATSLAALSDVVKQVVAPVWAMPVGWSHSTVQGKSVYRCERCNAKMDAICDRFKRGEYNMLRCVREKGHDGECSFAVVD